MKLRLISELKRILNKTEYKMKEVNDKVVVYYGDKHLYPEDYIEIELYENYYIVCEIHRDIKKIGVKTDKKTDAIVFAIVLCKRLYESDTGDKKVVRNVRQLVDEGNMNAAKELLKDNLVQDKYSIVLEEDKICLIQQGDKVNVRFHGKNLVENAKLSRGYVALYNYARNLMEISLIYDMVKINFDFSYGRNELEDIYIFGIVTSVD